VSGWAEGSPLPGGSTCIWGVADCECSREERSSREIRSNSLEGCCRENGFIAGVSRGSKDARDYAEQRGELRIAFMPHERSESTPNEKQMSAKARS
jgi:hypothetical protein